MMCAAKWKTFQREVRTSEKYDLGKKSATREKCCCSFLDREKAELKIPTDISKTHQLESRWTRSETSSCFQDSSTLDCQSQVIKHAMTRRDATTMRNWIPCELTGLGQSMRYVWRVSSTENDALLDYCKLPRSVQMSSGKWRRIAHNCTPRFLDNENALSVRLGDTRQRSATLSPVINKASIRIYVYVHTRTRYRYRT